MELWEHDDGKFQDNDNDEWMDQVRMESVSQSVVDQVSGEL